VTTVVIAPFNVVNFPEGGGHFWVYMQYVQGLRQLGCDVYWLEQFVHSGDAGQDRAMLARFAGQMEPYGLAGKIILFTNSPERDGHSTPVEFLSISRTAAEGILRRADLLLNFHYSIDPRLLTYFRRTALVDIDPGLLQFWMSTGQLHVPAHDFYFTIGETVGTATARFSDCGLPWHRIRPVVCLPLWPYQYYPQAEAFTTVSSWWSGAHGGEYLVDGAEIYDNNKRVSFLEFVELPRRTNQPLELALFLAPEDAADRKLLERYGWRVRHSREVAQTPKMYHSYIQGSRGEFSCTKPSYRRFQTAWISDRTLCYLASGKPVVVQDTGPSSFLPNGEGMFRFTTVEEAENAFACINAAYERHCQAARELAETYFDARQNLAEILRVSL
jgi:hypothetical protein